MTAPGSDVGVDVVAERDPGADLARQRVSVGAVQMGPTTHLAEERRRLGALVWEHFDARRLGATIGAELDGIDLTTELADAAIAELRAALAAYKVIFFRDQPLGPAEHLAFARRFGALEIHPFIPPNAEHPELVRFEKTADVAGYENAWHHDVTWRATPSMGAVLHAVQVPAVGGDTLFCDMYAAYDGLDADVRARIDDMDAVHDFLLAFGRQVPPDQLDTMRATYPQVVHPVAPRHAVTGRRHLYVNRIFVDRLVCDDADGGAGLLDLLCRQADYPEYQCRFRWEPDSVAFWDNRAVQHYASSDYWPEVRIMERASIVGTRPTR
jgi:taurine dioxygenase